MGIKMKCAAIWCLVSLASIATVTAATDLRLVEATKQGNQEALRALLQQHIDVNAPQPDGTVLVTDRIEFEPPGGLLGMMLTADRLSSTLNKGLLHRHNALKRCLEES